MRKVSSQQLIAGVEAKAWAYTYGGNGMDGLIKQRGNIIAASTISEERLAL